MKNQSFNITLSLSTAFLILLSFGQFLGFTFWHDDYTHLYKAQQGITSTFPYQIFSLITPVLYKAFGLNHFLYIALGMFFYWVCSILVYFLMREIFKDKGLSFFGALVFASGYLGQDSFKMFVGDGVGTLFVLPLVILVFITFLKGLKTSFKEYFLVSFMLSFLVWELAPHRYLGLIFPLILLDWFFYFKDRRDLKKVILRNFQFVLIFYLQFFIRPLDILLGINSNLTSSSKVGGLLVDLNKESLIVQLGNIWNFLFFSNFTLVNGFLSGLILVLLTGFLLVKTRSLKLLISVIFLSGLLTYFIAAPNLSLDTDNRYFMAYSFIPPIFLSALLLSLFNNKKIMLMISMSVIIALRLISANLTQNSFRENYVNHFNKIYSGMREILPEIKRPTLIYIEPSTREIRYALGDAFRVGELPPEAAFAVIYKTKMSNFILTETEEDIEMLVKKNNISKEDIYYFYYDGVRLSRIRDK